LQFPFGIPFFLSSSVKNNIKIFPIISSTLYWIIDWARTPAIYFESLSTVKLNNQACCLLPGWKNSAEKYVLSFKNLKFWFFIFHSWEEYFSLSYWYSVLKWLTTLCHFEMVEVRNSFSANENLMRNDNSTKSASSKWRLADVFLFIQVPTFHFPFSIDLLDI
jgi:hypothetical protein